MDREHQNERPDKGHHGNERVLGSVMRDLADFFQILGYPCDQMPGLLVVEEAERQLLQMIEDPASHFGLDRDPEHMPPVVNNELQAGIEKVNREQSRRRAQDQPPVLAREQFVDEPGDGKGKCQFEQPRYYGAAEIEQEQIAVRTVVGKELT